MKVVNFILLGMCCMTVWSGKTNSQPETDAKRLAIETCSDPEVIKYLDNFDKILASPSAWQGYVHDDIQLFVQIRNSEKVLVRNMTPEVLATFGVSTTPCYKNYLLADIKIKMPVFMILTYNIYV